MGKVPAEATLELRKTLVPSLITRIRKHNRVELKAQKLNTGIISQVLVQLTGTHVMPPVKVTKMAPAYLTGPALNQTRSA